MTDDKTNSRMRSIRVRKRLDDWAVAVVVALLLVGALGGWVAYQTHLNPSMETEEQTVATWDEQASLSHTAEVQQSNPVFDQGQVLSNQPLYFTQLAPELAGSYEYTYGASGEGELDVELAASLLIQAVDDDGGAYWTVTETLETAQYEGLAPGEQATLTAALDIPDVRNEISQIESDLGASVGTTEVEIQFDTQVTGVVNGQNVANAHQRSLSIEPGETTYSVQTEDNLAETHELTETVESEATYGPLRSYGPFVLILVSMLGLVGLAVANYRGWIPPSAAERAALEHHQKRREFDDWISTGAIPERARTGTEIELDSLEDLVDVAIDTSERVIEDRNTGDFVVHGENRYYIYSPSVGMLGPDESGAADSPGDSLMTADTESDAQDNGEPVPLLQDLEGASRTRHDGNSSETNGEQTKNDEGEAEQNAESTSRDQVETDS